MFVQLRALGQEAAGGDEGGGGHTQAHADWRAQDGTARRRLTARHHWRPSRGSTQRSRCPRRPSASRPPCGASGRPFRSAAPARREGRHTQGERRFKRWEGARAPTIVQLRTPCCYSSRQAADTPAQPRTLRTSLRVRAPLVPVQRATYLRWVGRGSARLAAAACTAGTAGCCRSPRPLPSTLQHPPAALPCSTASLSHPLTHMSFSAARISSFESARTPARLRSDTWRRGARGDTGAGGWAQRQGRRAGRQR